MKAFIRGEIFSTSDLHPYSDTWAAEIVGVDAIYKFKRKFIRGKKDYSYASGSGKGIFLEWVLESGRIYEISRKASRKYSERLFCTVTDEGIIQNLSEEEVIECLKRRSALMCLPQQNNVSLMCLTTFPAFTYHSAEEKTVR
jgi:hypothetical protein